MMWDREMGHGGATQAGRMMAPRDYWNNPFFRSPVNGRGGINLKLNPQKSGLSFLQQSETKSRKNSYF